MSSLTIAALAVTSAFALIFMALRVWKGGVWGLVSKTVASLSFLIFGILIACSGENFSTVKLLICIGLLFGVCGDVLLDFRQVKTDKIKLFTNAGMLSFGVGHVWYLAGIIVYAMCFVNVTAAGLAALIALPISAGGIFFVVKVLKMDVKGFLAQSFGYLLILTYVALFTVSLVWLGSVPHAEIFTIGAFLFLGSDIILSFQYFGGQEKNGVLTVFNHLCYYAAQLSYVSALYFLG